MKNECKVPKCTEPAYTKRGWCCKHYQRWKRYGDPLKGSTFQGEPEAFIKKALRWTSNACLTWPYQRDKDGYGQATIDGVKHQVHRYICTVVNGKPKAKQEAAHSCGKGHLGCINPKHLSWKSHIENMRDAVLMRQKSTAAAQAASAYRHRQKRPAGASACA